ncbi:uncharacterized protein METZ01_LOCUS213037, partial [marine metagenome]
QRHLPLPPGDARRRILGEPAHDAGAV